MKVKAVDLTKITPEERLQKVHEKVSELQGRIGRELQVVIYSSNLGDDQIDDIAKSLNLSVMSFPTGKESNEKYAVRVKGEKLGEIPFALSCLEIYSGGGDTGKPAFSDHTLAMAALTTAVINSLSPKQLHDFLASARKQGKISDEQFLLATQKFLTVDEVQT